jgi:hypothetical protein
MRSGARWRRSSRWRLWSGMNTRGRCGVVWCGVVRCVGVYGEGRLACACACGCKGGAQVGAMPRFAPLVVTWRVASSVAACTSPLCLARCRHPSQQQPLRPCLPQPRFSLVHRLAKPSSKPGSMWVGLLQEGPDGLYRWGAPHSLCSAGPPLRPARAGASHAGFFCAGLRHVRTPTLASPCPEGPAGPSPTPGCSRWAASTPGWRAYAPNG